MPPYFKSKYYTFCLKYFDKSLKYSIFATHYACTYTNFLVSNFIKHHFDGETVLSLSAVLTYIGIIILTI